MLRLVLRSWLNRVTAAPRQGRRPTEPVERLRSRLHLEALEGLCLPSTVTNLNDSGPGSLRDAIANTPPGGTVDFQTGLTGTIILTTGELAITKNLTIDGPGADVITVSGHHASRVFNIAFNDGLAIFGLRIADGVAPNAGGGIENAGFVTLDGCTLSGNSATGSNSAGGAIAGGLVQITNSTLTSNSAVFGGAIAEATVTVTDSTLEGNSANFGGAIRSGGMLTIRGSMVSSNHAHIAGGAIENFDSVAVSDSTLAGNSVFGGNGGAIDNAAGTVMVTGSTLSGNVGGGILNNGGTLTVTDSALSGNLGTGISSVSSRAMATINRSTVSNNQGGGIADGFGRVTVVDSTVSSNLAIGVDEQGGMTTVNNSTISRNSSPTRGAGININGGMVLIKDTIVAENTSSLGPDVYGSLASQGHNLIGNPADSDGYLPSDLLNFDPRLGPLQDNGGPTLTMALLPGSPAIGAGDPTGAPMWDQRGPGYPRLINGRIDIGAFEVQNTASSYVVTNTNDAGPGSLRQAILNADGSADPVTITFAIPSSGIQTIRPLSPLPTLTTAAIIDGTSQPGYAGRPLLVLDGSAAGAGADGLTVAAGNSTVEGLAIDAFAGAGIHLEGPGGDLVTGNYLGTDATGTLSVGNGTGVFISLTAGNTVGGTTPEAANLISGNGQAGIAISGSENLVEGNLIGTNATGTAALPNGVGVGIFYLGAGNTIGGTAEGAGNLISGNLRDGVAIDGGSGNLVEGNRIGTDASGTAALPNRFGIELFSGSTTSTVGGTAPGAGNVIAGNAHDGVGIYSNANVLEGNFIGTDPSGTLDLGNGGNGIAVRAFKYGDDNLVGGTVAGAGNVIAHNAADGVLVDTGTGNALRQNSIFANAGLGIELVNGGNNNQAFPILTTATSDGRSTTINGTLQSAPDTVYRLEFFANDVCNPSGYGEGQTFLGGAPVPTGDTGSVTFSVTLLGGEPDGEPVSATATDPGGNTSPFAACVAVSSAAAAGRTPSAVRAIVVPYLGESPPTPVPARSDPACPLQPPADFLVALWGQGALPAPESGSAEPMRLLRQGTTGQNPPGLGLVVQADETDDLDLWGGPA